LAPNGRSGSIAENLSTQLPPGARLPKRAVTALVSTRKKSSR
jgi:hypothetical protein